MRADLYDTLLFHIAKMLKLFRNQPKLPCSTFHLHVVCEADVVNVFTDNFWLLQRIIASCHTRIADYRLTILHVYILHMEKTFDTTFDTASSGQPYMVYPKVFSDNRGSFSEVLVEEDIDNIRQINRSVSCQWTIRGCHAQRAPHCQSKLVEALTIPIYDIITDARPDSKTFGLTEAYYLDPSKQNKLFVPHGFLHAFAVPEFKESANQQAMFMYYCDDIYSKADEVGVNPMSIFPRLLDIWEKNVNENNILWDLVQMLKTPDKLVLSKKDTEARSYQSFMEEVSKEYQNSKSLWYCKSIKT